MADSDNPAQGGAKPNEPDPAASATPGGRSTPDGATPKGEGEGARPDAGLGDEGKAALEKERDARRDAERTAAQLRDRLNELQDAGKSDVERTQSQLRRAQDELTKANERVAELQGDIERRELDTLKAKIAAEEGLPGSVAKRLSGKDAREIRADAKSLREELQAGTPVGDLGLGRGGAASGTRRGQTMNDMIREAAGRG